MQFRQDNNYNYRGEIVSHKANVVRNDESNDLSIIKISDNSFKKLPSLPYNLQTRSVDVGTEVYALGYPMALSGMGTDIKFTDADEDGIVDGTGFNVDGTVAGSDGVLFQKGTLSPTNPVSVIYGGKELGPEESTNVSYGIVWDATDSLNITIDAYSIELEDRITQGDDVTLSAADIANLQAQGVPGAGDLTNFRFYVNDYDTDTDGIDLVATYSAEMGNGTTDFTFVHSQTTTEVDKTSGLVGAARIGQLESLLPESRWNLTAVHNTGDWSLMARYNWVDEWIWWDIYADPVFSETVDDMFTLDLEVRRDLGAYTLTLGAQNVTDEVPDNPASTLCCGMKYPEGSPLGFNGAFYYFKVGLDF